jgi:enamine deaminase RidA (YjgF/YER057c/UK114 family)
MFTNALSGLRAEGMSYTQVIRTWIYIARLLDWYGDFNRVRTEFHDQQGMVRGGRDSVFPASTGIQGRSGAGVECCMDLLAIDTYGEAEVDPIIGSERQPPAFTYGSGFSRGMVLTLEGTKMVFVSGTASTNAAGEVAHLKQPEAQCMETLMSIAAILKEQGGGLEDICVSTLFCKTPEVYEAYESVNELLGLREFPTVPVLADVCRPEWLVEIEAVAIIDPGRQTPHLIEGRAAATQAR